MKCRRRSQIRRQMKIMKILKTKHQPIPGFGQVLLGGHAAYVIVECEERVEHILVVRRRIAVAALPPVAPNGDDERTAVVLVVADLDILFVVFVVVVVVVVVGVVVFREWQKIVKCCEPLT